LALLLPQLITNLHNFKICCEIDYAISLLHLWWS